MQITITITTGSLSTSRLYQVDCGSHEQLKHMRAELTLKPGKDDWDAVHTSFISAIATMNGIDPTNAVEMDQRIQIVNCLPAEQRAS